MCIIIIQIFQLFYLCVAKIEAHSCMANKQCINFFLAIQEALKPLWLPAVDCASPLYTELCLESINRCQAKFHTEDKRGVA